MKKEVARPISEIQWMWLGYAFRLPIRNAAPSSGLLPFWLDGNTNDVHWYSQKCNDDCGNININMDWNSPRRYVNETWELRHLCDTPFGKWMLWHRADF
jgi:hypothetical protein